MTSSIPKILGRPTWQQTMLRISNPTKTLPFYTDIMGMTIIDTMDFPQWKFKLYFLSTLPQGMKYDLTPGTQAAHVCEISNVYIHNSFSMLQTILILTSFMPSFFFAYYHDN